MPAVARRNPARHLGSAGVPGSRGDTPHLQVTLDEQGHRERGRRQDHVAAAD
jgi:hypothetical protein